MNTLKDFNKFSIEYDIIKILESNNSDSEKQYMLNEYIINNNIDEGILKSIIGGVKSAIKGVYNYTFGNMLDLPSLPKTNIMGSIKNIFKGNSTNAQNEPNTGIFSPTKAPNKGDLGYNAEIQDTGETDIMIKSPKVASIMKIKNFIRKEWIYINGEDETLNKTFFQDKIFRILSGSKKFEVKKIWELDNNYIERYLDEYHIHFKIRKYDYYIDVYIKNCKPDIESKLMQLLDEYRNILTKEVDIIIVWDKIMMDKMFLYLVRDSQKYNTNK